MKRIFVIILGAGATGAICGLSGFLESAGAQENPAVPNRSLQTSAAPRDRDEFSGKVVTDLEMAIRLMKIRQPNAPRVGQMAPEFTLKRAGDGREVTLSQLRKEKPVVLFFMSWGCDVFCLSVEKLKQMHQEYGERANFVGIYIRDAHPRDGFGKEAGKVRDPRTDEERTAVALRFRKELGLPFPILIDPVADPVATRWAGWPVRVFVVETDGKVAYAGAQGPWGYRPYPSFEYGERPRVGWDLKFSAETLKEFLEARFSEAANSERN